MRWKKDYTVLDRYEKIIQAEFIKLREILMPELINYEYYGSHGIFSPERDFRAGVSYDIIQESRYKIAWFEHPEGGNTVDFGRPLRCEDDPYPSVNALCSKKDGKTILDMDAVPDQTRIMLTALKVKGAENYFDIRKMFSYYTDNVQALSCAERLTQIYAEIPDDKRFKRNIPMMNDLIIMLETSLEQETQGRQIRFRQELLRFSQSVPSVLRLMNTCLFTGGCLRVSIRMPAASVTITLQRRSGCLMGQRCFMAAQLS